MKTATINAMTGKENFENMKWIGIRFCLWILTPATILQFFIMPIPLPFLFRLWWAIAFLVLGSVCMTSERLKEEKGFRFYIYGVLSMLSSILTISL